jgi:hypothetical protein
MSRAYAEKAILIRCDKNLATVEDFGKLGGEAGFAGLAVSV